MSLTVASKTALASFAVGVGHLAYIDFVLVPAYLQQWRSVGASAPVSAGSPAPASAAPRVPASAATRIVRRKPWVILFGFGRADLDAAAAATLEQVLRAYEQEPSPVEVAGYTDASGDAAYNAYLSRTRARAVAEWLVARGVPADRIDLRAYGEQRARRAGRQDRRVEIRLGQR